MQVESAEQKLVVDYFASTICMGSFSHWAFSSIMDNFSVTAQVISVTASWLVHTELNYVSSQIFRSLL